MGIPSEIEAMERGLSDRGLTAKALCEASGINQSTWTRWKAGQTAPNLATWQRVLDAYRREIDGASCGIRAAE